MSEALHTGMMANVSVGGEGYFTDSIEPEFVMVIYLATPVYLGSQ